MKQSKQANAMPRSNQKAITSGKPITSGVDFFEQQQKHLSNLYKNLDEDEDENAGSGEESGESEYDSEESGEEAKKDEYDTPDDEKDLEKDLEPDMARTGPNGEWQEIQALTPA